MVCFVSSCLLAVMWYLFIFLTRFSALAVVRSLKSLLDTQNLGGFTIEQVLKVGGWCYKINFAGGADIILWCSFFCFSKMKEIMNQEKLAKLQAQVRIGGKVCRKKNCMKCSIFFKTHNLLFEFCTTSLNAKKGGGKNALTEERLHKILSHPGRRFSRRSLRTGDR